MSPKEPEPIFRPKRYLLPTRSSMSKGHAANYFRWLARRTNFLQLRPQDRLFREVVTILLERSRTRVQLQLFINPHPPLMLPFLLPVPYVRLIRCSKSTSPVRENVTKKQLVEFRRRFLLFSRKSGKRPWITADWWKPWSTWGKCTRPSIVARTRTPPVYSTFQSPVLSQKHQIYFQPETIAGFESSTPITPALGHLLYFAR